MDDAPKPVLSGKVTHEEFQQYLGYVEKHGTREQVVSATLGGAGVYATAYAQKIAKEEAAGAAGVVAGAPVLLGAAASGVAVTGVRAAAAGALAGGTQGFVQAVLDEASAAEVAVRTAAGAALGATIGWAANKIGPFITGEASPSTPGAGKTDSVGLKPVSGEPAPQAPLSDAPAGLNTGPFEVPPQTAKGSGPVRFKPPANATAEQLAQWREATQIWNESLEAGELSPTGRVSTKGTLRREATRDVAKERARAAAAGTPYRGHAAHMPDTTWTGKPTPPRGYKDYDPSVNTSMGSQAKNYPVGYKPTEFVLEEPKPGEPK